MLRRTSVGLDKSLVGNHNIRTRYKSFAAKHANRLLITGFDETADELTALASAAKAKDQTKFRAIRAQLLDRTPPGLSDVLEGSRELVAAGYRLGL